MDLIKIHSGCREILGAESDEIERFTEELTKQVNKGNDNDWAIEAEYYIKLALSNVLYDKRLMIRVVDILSEQEDYKQIFESDDA